MTKLISDARSPQMNEVRPHNAPTGRLLSLISVCLVAAVVTNASSTAGDAKDPLYDVVVQGISENCRKFDCGALTWHAEQRQQAGGLQYISRMWWDGDKVAINATNWKLSGQNGEDRQEKKSTHVKIFDGNEYRGIVVGSRTISLEKRPRFNQFDNYLKDYGWPGYSKSIVERLADDMNREEVSLEWSMVESNGAKRVRLKRTYQDRDNYYELYYFDPVKGCMLSEEEVYNSNGLTYACKWTLEEVSAGMWFPAEGNQHGKVTTRDGQNLSYTTKVAVDMEKSTFNDRSAIPEDIFELEITPDIDAVIDHRLSDPPAIYRKGSAELLAIQELDKAAKELVNEGPPVPSEQPSEDTQLDAGTHLTADSIPNSPNETVLDLLSQTAAQDTPSRLFPWLLTGGGILLVALGIAAYCRRRQRGFAR